MSLALYRKYRPQAWDEVLGQEHIIQTLRNSIAADRISHAYLFAGPRGTGKTTVARLLAKAVNCLAENLAERPCNRCAHCLAVGENRFLDLIEIDAASNTGVDDVRDLRDKINFTPTQGRYKIYIVDEVHMLSTPAFNALLKTLEEPPPHAIFVLATTDIQKIPATVISRCQRHEFRRVSVKEITTNLGRILKAEGIIADEDALQLIARQATGSIRDAQSLLDQLASTGQKITIALVQNVLGTATGQTVLELVDALRDGNPAGGVESIHRALDSGADPRALARQAVDYLRGVMLIQMGNESQVEAAAEVKSQMRAHAQAFSKEAILRMTKAFNAAATDLRAGWQPSLSLELALADVTGNPGTDENPGRLKEQAVAGPRGQGITKSANQQSRSAEGQTRKQSSGRSAIGSGAIAEEPRVNYDSTEMREENKPGKETANGTPAVIQAGEIIQVWKQMTASIHKTQPNLAALLNSVKLVDVQGDTLVLGFAGQVLVEKMEKPDYVETTCQALKDILAVQLKLRCVLTNAKGKLPPNISQDGMVAAALNQGGEIVDTQD